MSDKFDLKWLKANAFFGCQNGLCAEEMSYPYDMMWLYNNQPICQNCVDNDVPEAIPSDQLTPFDPFAFISKATQGDPKKAKRLGKLIHKVGNDLEAKERL